MGVEIEHEEYQQALPIWQRIRDVEAGEDAVKQRCVEVVSTLRRPQGSDINARSYLTAALTSYLPKPEGQDLFDYATYLSDAEFYNATARTIDGMVGAVWRVDPAISLTGPLVELEDDADRQQTPLDVLAKAALRDVITFGRSGVLLDLPMEPASSGAVPYLCRYRPWDITNWRVTMTDDGPLLTLVVLREHYSAPDPDDPFADVTLCRYRVLVLDEGVYRVRIYEPPTLEGGEYELALEVTPAPRRGAPLDFIPFVFIGPQNLQPDIAKPPILDLVNLNLHNFRLSAKLNHGLFVVSVPQPFTVGAGTSTAEGQAAEFRIGGNLAWDLPAGADARFLEHDGQGIASISDAIVRNETRMALLGARLLEPQKREAETAEALRLRQSGESATLAAIASTVSWGLSKVLGWAAEWTGQNPDQNFITLNQEFSDATMTETEAVELVSRWQMGGATEDDMFLLLQKGGKIEPEITLEQWKMKRRDQAPVAPRLEDPEDEDDTPAGEERPAA